MPQRIALSNLNPNNTHNMTNNEQRQIRRRQVNRLKRELAAMRTADIAERVQKILGNPEQLEFLATLFVLWRLQLTHTPPGNNTEERHANRTLLALDEALSSFSQHEYLLEEADTDYIRGAENPFAPLPQGWSYDAASAQSHPRCPGLQMITWRWVFFKDGKLAAGFEDIDDARDFFAYLKTQHADTCPRITDSQQLTKKENASPGLFFKRKDIHPTIMRKAGEGAFTVSVMPPLTPIELEDTIADRIVTALNLAAEEVERYWQNHQKTK